MQIISLLATYCYTRLVTLVITHTGKAGHVSQMENSGGSSKYSRYKVPSQDSQEQNSGTSESQNNGKRELSCYDNYLWFGPKGSGGRYLFSIKFLLILFQGVLWKCFPNLTRWEPHARSCPFFFFNIFIFLG